MSTVEPSSPQPSLTPKPGLLTRWNTVPRWVLIAFIVAIAIAGYWIYQHFSSSNSGTSDTSSWRNSAIDFLTSQGYEASTSQEAIDNYVNGRPLSPSQIVLVAAAIGALGVPTNVTSNATTQAQLSTSGDSGLGTVGGGTGQGGVAVAGSPYPGAGGTASTTSTDGLLGFWYVPVGVAGWSTTWQGIANQFGVSTQALMAANPTITVTTTYGRLPVGTTVKVPR
jgi:hypothetical protein